MHFNKNRWLITAGICFLLAMLTLAARAAGPAATNSVTLAWTPPIGNPTPYSFRLYANTNAAAPLPWLVVTNLPMTQSNATFLVTKTMMFYYMTCVVTTNGIERESDPSNVALDPWPFQGYGLQITK